MSKGRAPSIYDVAERAGVSHQTVSRVLNGFTGIRPATRERVQAAITELGFRRSVAAHSLATNRSRSIGVLTLTTADYGPVSTLLAVEQAIRETGYRPLITSATPEAAGDGVEFLRAHAVEALVAITPYRGMRDQLGEVGVPMVTLLAGDGAMAARVDQRTGIRELVAHLVGLGHRRIQYVAGPEGYIEADERRAMVAEECARRGLETLPVLEGDWTAESGYRAAASIDPTVTAVMAANDHMALGVLHGLAERGIDVPGRMSVTGFDDIPEAAHAHPPLTTVRQDFTALGRIAVARLVALLADPDAAPPQPVPPRLVVRASTHTATVSPCDDAGASR